jgi:hypothetical protein
MGAANAELESAFPGRQFWLVHADDPDPSAIRVP